MQPKEKFERDLGEGRKLKVDPSTMQNNSSRVTAVSAVWLCSLPAVQGPGCLEECNILCLLSRGPRALFQPVLTLVASPRQSVLVVAFQVGSLYSQCSFASELCSC